jgi:predicted hydrocarbon binding protein
MSASHNPELVPFDLPLMYVDPHRMLTTVTAYLDDLSVLDRLRDDARGSGASLKLLYLYQQPPGGRFLAAWTIDTTDAGSAAAKTANPAEILQRLSAIPGLDIVNAMPPASGLAVFEHFQVQVVGVPMIVMAKEVIGGAFRSFAQAAGHEEVLRTGERMGRLAASAVPPLLVRLGVPLTKELVQQRVMDFQVFGWAAVRNVSLNDALQGEIELNGTFESTPWHGQADASTCDFIRGFTVGVFSTAFDRRFDSAEPECQGKGDPHCRITLQPVA